MKQILSFVLAVLVFSSCTKTLVVHNSKPLPPGQAKKVAGAKSASSFTPAAQKKSNSAAAPVKGKKK